MALDALSVDEGAVLAAQIDQEEFLSVLHDLRVVARDARVRNHQIFIDFPSNCERSAVQDDVLLLATLHKDKGGKHTGTGTAVTDCAKGHEWSFRVPFALTSDDLGRALQGDIPAATDYSAGAMSRKVRAWRPQELSNVNPRMNIGTKKLEYRNSKCQTCSLTAGASPR